MAGKDSSLDVVILGLDGFGLRAATEDDGELLMLVETTAAVVGCSGCGTRARSSGRRRTKVRDLPVGGRPTVLVWCMGVWRCAEAACEVGSWSETSPLGSGRGRCCRSGHDARQPGGSAKTEPR